MRQYILFTMAALTLMGCSNEVTDQSAVLQTGDPAPIAFNTYRPNITRANTALEELNHYNFGIYAYKVNTDERQQFMDNYLVGYSDGTSKGYDHSGATTWAATAGTQDDHLSPWFYEHLGKSQYTYTGDVGFYKTTDTGLMSAKDNQYLTYWDKAYANTEFYFYSPYDNSGKVTFDYDTKTLTLGNGVVTDGYDNPLNENYKNKTGLLSDFLFGTKTVSKSEYDKDVTELTFNRLGSRVLIAFYDDITGYKVEIVDLNADGGNIKSGYTGYKIQGIQATPFGCTIDDNGLVTLNTDKTVKASYNIDSKGSTISLADNKITLGTGTATASTSTDNLMFLIPGSTAATNIDNTLTPANLTDLTIGTTTHKCISEKVASGTQKYSYSPTVYYPMPQPSYEAGKSAGFTFHITYRIIKEDNNEIVTVHNATVYVPPYFLQGTEKTKTNLTLWEPNKQYTYIFRITGATNGSTDPDTPIDPDDPDAPTDPALVPIVLDNMLVESFNSNGTTSISPTGVEP